MKGIELPINILVIVAVAIIVLLGVIALFYGGFTGPAGVVTQDAAKSAGCKIVMSNVGGCQTVDPTTVSFATGSYGIPKFDANGDGLICPDITNPSCVAATPADTLQALCERYFGISSTSPTRLADCRKVCGCTA